MGKRKKINHRAEQARRRNAERAAQRQKAAQRQAFWAQHKKPIIISAVAAVAAIVLIFLGCKLFIGPGGSIPNFFGTLRGVQDNWIVTNTGTTSSPRYYKMGEYDAPQGYTLDPDYNVSSDKLNQSLYFNADSQDAVISTIYLSGVKDVSAAEQLDKVLDYGMYQESSGPLSGTLGGHEASYAYFLYSTTENAPEDASLEELEGYAGLCVYIDTVQDSCVLVMLNSATASLADAPSQETLLAAAEELVARLTIPQ